MTVCRDIVSMELAAEAICVTSSALGSGGYNPYSTNTKPCLGISHHRCKRRITFTWIAMYSVSNPHTLESPSATAAFAMSSSTKVKGSDTFIMKFPLTTDGTNVVVVVLVVEVVVEVVVVVVEVVVVVGGVVDVVVDVVVVVFVVVAVVVVVLVVVPLYVVVVAVEVVVVVVMLVEFVVVEVVVVVVVMYH